MNPFKACFQIKYKATPTSQLEPILNDPALGPGTHDPEDVSVYWCKIYEPADDVESILNDSALGPATHDPEDFLVKITATRSEKNGIEGMKGTKIGIPDDVSFPLCTDSLLGPVSHDPEDVAMKIPVGYWCKIYEPASQRLQPDDVSLRMLIYCNDCHKKF